MQLLDYELDDPGLESRHKFEISPSIRTSRPNLKSSSLSLDGYVGSFTGKMRAKREV
jgi:hypothetical protein